ncbi:MAG: glycosyltransferase [Proteobacteria bacterium]|nr:glycosyltransferase [Pseudomonadota bacterium]
MKIAVIMRAKNSDWVIDQALTGLFAQRGVTFEAIVVDSGSTDRTLEIVRRFPVRLVQIEPRAYFPGKVLNDAIAATDADVIVFQNSDVVPLHRDVLARLLEPFATPAVMATFARQVPRPDAHTWVRAEYARSFPEHGDAPAWIPYSLPLAAMRRSAWARRPFSTEAWASEDSTWGAATRAAGERIAYVAEALVMHSHNYTLREIWGRRFVEGEADAFVDASTLPVTRVLARLGTSLARDVRDHVVARDPWGLVRSPARRLAYHAGFLRGPTTTPRSARPSCSTAAAPARAKTAARTTGSPLSTRCPM